MTSGGSAAAAGLWARADLRARWKSIIALGLIAGITAGLALAALAGANSTGTALDRLREHTNASDAVVFPSQVGVFHPDWSALTARPEVRSVARWALVDGLIDGDPEGVLFTPVGDEWMQKVDTPVVMAGRMFDPAADDEVVVADAFAARTGIHVGDTIPFVPYTDDDVEGVTTPDDLTGPHLTMRVVGLVRTPLEPLFVTDGLVVASPGLTAQHPEIAFYENAYVQLRHPTTDVPALRARAGADLAPGAPVLDLNAVTRRVTTTTDVERTALLLLAAAIALAGLVLVGQMVARSAGVIAVDSTALRGIGMRRSSIALGPLLAHLTGAVVAFLVCIGTAVVASQWLPLGLAGRIDPDRGVHFHVPMVVPGAVALVVLLLAGTFGAAWLAAAPPSVDRFDAPNGIAAVVRRHASLIVGLGTTMALRPGRGRNGVAVRPALLGAIVGVLGVATAVTMEAGLSDTLDHPERAGVTWDAVAAPQDPEAYTEHGFVAGFEDAVRGADGVVDAARMDRAVLPVAGGAGVPTFAMRPLGTDASTTMALATLSGRAPTEGDEAAVGPETARVLGLHVGDTVQVGEPPVDVTIVGTALFPSDVHAEFDEGMWLSPAGFDAVSGSDGSSERFALVRVADGTDVDDALGTLTAATADWNGFALPAEIPPELQNLENVLPLPKLLAVFLAVLGIAALLHVLSASSRSRERDFAVLRALGLTRRGTRLVLNVQGTTVLLVGLLIGIPLGVALGRTAWKLTAASVPLAQVTPVAVLALVLLVPTALLVAQVLAFAPGRRVALLQPAEVLRTE